MRLVELLPQRFRTHAPEAVKFAVIGGLNVIVNALVFNLLILTVFIDGQLKAKVIATAVAVVSSYFMNRHWTYRDRDKSAAHREFVLFVFFNAAGMAIELAVMGATKYWLGLTSVAWMNVAMVVGLGLGTIFRFFTYRTYVFLHAEPEPKFAVASDFAEITAPLEAEFRARKTSLQRKKRGARKSPATVRSR